MKSTFAILVLIIVSSCDLKRIDHYFENFTSIDHYSFPENHSDSIYNYGMAPCDTSFNSIEKTWCEIIHNKLRSLEIFKAYGENMEPSGFHKFTITDDKMLSEFKDVFTPFEPDEYYGNECAPIYRDVFVFKNSDKIIGIAQICFQCEHYHFIGAKENIGTFHGAKKYEDLRRLIKTYCEPPL